MYAVTSPDKNDTKSSNFGSVVCFLGHIWEAMSSPKVLPIQPKLDANECHVCLPQLRAVIHIGRTLVIIASRYLLGRLGENDVMVYSEKY